MSEYILLISLSVLIIAGAIGGDQKIENGTCNCENIQKNYSVVVNEVKTLKRETEKSIEAMESQTENTIKIETTKIIDMQKNKIDALKIEINDTQNKHENTIDALKIDMQKELNALKKKIDALKIDMQKETNALKKKIDKLVAKLNDSNFESFMRYIKHLWPE